MATIEAFVTLLNQLLSIGTQIWNALKTPQAQTDQGIDAQEQANKQSAENTGKPV